MPKPAIPTEYTENLVPHGPESDYMTDQPLPRHTHDTGVKKFAYRSDITHQMLVNALALMPTRIASAKHLKELPNPRTESDQEIAWTIGIKNIDPALPQKATGHYTIRFMAQTKTFSVSILYSATPGMTKDTVNTRAIGFRSETEILTFLKQARSWSIEKISKDRELK